MHKREFGALLCLALSLVSPMGLRAATSKRQTVEAKLVKLGIMPLEIAREISRQFGAAEFENVDDLMGPIAQLDLSKNKIQNALEPIRIVVQTCFLDYFGSTGRLSAERIERLALSTTNTHSRSPRFSFLSSDLVKPFLDKNQRGVISRTKGRITKTLRKLETEAKVLQKQ